MDMTNISSLTQYYSNMASTQGTSSLSSSLTSLGSTDATDEELMDACKQFEAYFLEQVFKEMQNTVMKAEEDDGSTGMLVDYFKEQMISELATQSTETSPLGLAQMLYDQMQRNLSTTAEQLMAESQAVNE